MSHISGKETKPEVQMRKLLFLKGLRYRKNVKSLPGKPDIVFPKYNTIVFINGCFWHGHEGCIKSKLPETRTTFWKNKITSNIKHDINIKIMLNKAGWKVFTIWQCEINNKVKREKCSESLFHKITGSY